MVSVGLVLISLILLFGAYLTYGKFVARKIFRLDDTRKCPSEEFRDNMDYIPTHKRILFGHHFTSIAGTGPIVGPAIAVIWGWLPAIIWIIIGSVFIGAVHDLGAMVLSIRHRGRSIGDLCLQVINKRVRGLFLLIIFLLLWLVIAVFGLVIALVFRMFPQAVLPVFLQIPIAVGLGYFIYKKNYNYTIATFVAVFLLYVTIVIGTFLPLQMPGFLGLNSLAIWTIMLLIYAYLASILPVQVLLQPRDYINAYQLLIAMGLLVLGIVLTRPPLVAPVVNLSVEGAPPVWPMLFVIVACGAISGFHSLVSSGTSSKQCDRETSARFIGYGGMLTEAFLAVLVIIACGAGLGIGLMQGKNTLTGTAAFQHHYASWGAAQGLGTKIGAFVGGSSNMVDTLGIPHSIVLTIMGVFVASFAATTLDTATRLQRYIISEIARVGKVKLLTRKHPATLAAVGLAFLLAFYNGTGRGALILWPLFGTSNQLLAGLALLVITIYLARKNIPVIFTMLPMLFMLIMTAWAMIYNLKWFFKSANWLLFYVGLAVSVLQIWMAIESYFVWRKIRDQGRLK